MFCTNCGSKLAGAAFCPQCGEKQSGAAPQPAPIMSAKPIDTRKYLLLLMCTVLMVTVWMGWIDFNGTLYFRGLNEQGHYAGRYRLSGMQSLSLFQVTQEIFNLHRVVNRAYRGEVSGIATQNTWNAGELDMGHINHADLQRIAAVMLPVVLGLGAFLFTLSFLLLLFMYRIFVDKKEKLFAFLSLIPIAMLGVLVFVGIFFINRALDELRIQPEMVVPNVDISATPWVYVAVLLSISILTLIITFRRN